ncbi:hypothetical protein JK635_07930 [Neobacillus sp. YIM B02564]|uniref:DUF4878 domain-containing protein n=1 Tax=Neobacillus paridis TaxID=2803862 RepID=A0ABS1TN33_9BACI|nr:hypothetical protein [Neobacillus paridis]MBL4952139.1 hypothetical protein [Neobacillus paridis]
MQKAFFRHRTKLSVIVVFTLAISLVLSACDTKEDPNLKPFAKEYTENLMKGNWSRVAKDSTGEQLSVFLLLSDQLSQTEFTSDVRLVKVLKTTMIDDTTATALVHVVRDMEVEKYGRITDDRQILLSLQKVDKDWKVYRTDVVFEK